MLLSIRSSQPRSFSSSSHHHRLFDRSYSLVKRGSNSSGPAIGIDLGTTNSCVAALQGSNPVVLENLEGMRTTPSVVAYLPNGERLVGEAAKRQSIMNPFRTISAAKRLIGRRFDEQMTKNNRHMFPYKIVPSINGDAFIEIDGKSMSPSEIAAAILAKMKDTAEMRLLRPVTDCVITVPAYFNDSQKQATIDAGRIAGMNVKRIIAEPTAAALAYGFKESDSGKTIAVYDLGGGTFDISILDISDNVFEVRSTNGDTSLGGEDFDHRILHHLLQEFKQISGVDLRHNAMAMQRLKEAAEKAKCELSHVMSVQVELPYICNIDDKPQHLNISITRDHLQRMCQDLIDRTLVPCRAAMQDAKVDRRSLNEVLLVGGMTRMPSVQNAVREFFGREPSKNVNPDEAVAMGAAIQATVLAGGLVDMGGIVVIDVTPLTLGTSIVGDVFVPLIARNTPVPCKGSGTFTTTEDYQTGIDVSVYQGERSRASSNKLLGQFTLTGLLPLPRGGPSVEMIFELDVNGIVHATAIDKQTGKKGEIRVQSKGGLSEEEIQQKIRESESFRLRDQLFRENQEKKQKIYTQLYNIERSLDENSKRLDGATVAQIIANASELRKCVETLPIEEIEKRLKMTLAQVDKVMQQFR
eukprot:TRINITY_DN6032_c0_g1_i1.p1 TRINITY_DN6032_c0_g1~~TRINITY_DN6032_c0_g1_i1.p1  ORF type:complete len:639 (+),score=168.10 TRINITY_DN6032_c0_g1_i1:151-2067(+)